ncbi:MULTISPECIES: hypothetical protein [unclassified Streptomyces]|uniref:hypothetical protein n=1 Tax=unclassified Streptomyces TaxID=2593676 RepID=UPI00382D9D77
MTDPDRSVWSLALAVRWAGRLLCWSLGAGMVAAAVDLTVAPRASWWQTLWPLPWYTTAASALLWAVLRAREKCVLSGGDDDPQTDEEVYAEWDQAA